MFILIKNFNISTSLDKKASKLIYKLGLGRNHLNYQIIPVPSIKIPTSNMLLASKRS